jgi:phytanoyl-CoA hydroxylase
MKSVSNDPAQLRHAFDRDGYISIADFLSEVEVAEVNRQMRSFLTNDLSTMPSELVYFEEKNERSSLKQIQRLADYSQYFRNLAFDSRFERLAEALLGEPVIGKNMQYFNKPAGVGKATPPHQDGYYFMLQPNRALTMWLALEDVALEQGCVNYLRGSHQNGLLPHVPSGTLGFSQQLDDLDACANSSDKVSFPCRAGHLIAHHSLTVHWAEANRSLNKGREALGFIYYGKSAREDLAAHAAYQEKLAKHLANSNRI